MVRGGYGPSTSFLLGGALNGFLGTPRPHDPEMLTCMGGPYYDCRLNKWGDKIVLSDCHFELREQGDFGQGKGLKKLLEPVDQAEGIGHGAQKAILPNRGWYSFDPPPPPAVKKICCRAPATKCIDVDSWNVSVSAAPVRPVLPPAHRGLRRRSAADPTRTSCRAGTGGGAALPARARRRIIARGFL
uniref:Uncharacterized protein n=1 Tax=Alexandrium monilatum TaxID=311494 RepID=A0A7S4STE7_9DINO